MAKELFSFIHATDLHCESGSADKMPVANLRTACFIEDINEEKFFARPSFIIISGDLSERGSAYSQDLVVAETLCDLLKVPYFIIPGNHDLAPDRETAAHYPGKEDYHEGSIDTSNYVRVFGRENLSFSFKHDSIHFLGMSLRNDDPDKMLDWLENEINTTKLEKIIVSHYGLYPARKAGPLAAWGFRRISSIITRLKSIVENPDNNVIAYLYGHNHINSVVLNKGIHHISGGGIQKGCTGYRLFRVHKDRIETEFYPLSDNKLCNFNYWGENNPTVCVDKEHPALEIYHRGTDNENRFRIKRNIAQTEGHAPL